MRSPVPASDPNRTGPLAGAEKRRTQGLRRGPRPSWIRPLRTYRRLLGAGSSLGQGNLAPVGQRARVGRRRPVVTTPAEERCSAPTSDSPPLRRQFVPPCPHRRARRSKLARWRDAPAARTRTRSTRPGESGDRRGCPLTLAVNVRRAAYGGRRLRATILGSRKGGGVLREKPVVGAAPPWLVEAIRIGRSGLRVVERGRRHVRRTLRSFRKKHPDTASVLLVCLVFSRDGIPDRAFLSAGWRQILLQTPCIHRLECDKVPLPRPGARFDTRGSPSARLDSDPFP